MSENHLLLEYSAPRIIDNYKLKNQSRSVPILLRAHTHLIKVEDLMQLFRGRKSGL